MLVTARSEFHPGMRGVGEGTHVAAGASRCPVCARPRGGGREGGAYPRRPLVPFPHFTLLLRSLLPVCHSRTHVCKSMVFVTRRPCALGRTGPECTGGGGQVDSGRASLPLQSSLTLSLAFPGLLVPRVISLLCRPLFCGRGDQSLT